MEHSKLRVFIKKDLQDHHHVAHLKGRLTRLKHIKCFQKYFQVVKLGRISDFLKGIKQIFIQLQDRLKLVINTLKKLKKNSYSSKNVLQEKKFVVLYMAQF